MKTCHACGAYVTEDWHYCNKCGAKRKGGSAKKIGVGIVVSLVIFVALVGLDIYAASSLQFRSEETGNFDWADLSLDVVMSVCNPTFMPTSFDEISADLNYKSSRIGTFTLWGSYLPPNSAQDVNGRINIDGMNVLKIIFGGMMAGLSGQDVQYNEDDFNIDLKINKAILGIIPFSFEKNYPASEISSFLEGRSSGWDCDGPSGPLDTLDKLRQEIEKQGESVVKSGEEMIEEVLEQTQKALESTELLP